MEWQSPNHGRGHDGPSTSPTKRVEIALVERKIVDVALARILQLSRRTALPAPIQRRDGETAIEQLLDRLEIFLDEFGAPAQDRHGAARSARGNPARRAQLHPVDGASRRDDRSRRDRIVGGGDETHACGSAERAGRLIGPRRRAAKRAGKSRRAIAGSSLAPTRPDARAEERSRRAPPQGDARTAQSRSRPTPTSAPAKRPRPATTRRARRRRRARSQLRSPANRCGRFAARR